MLLCLSLKPQHTRCVKQSQGSTYNHFVQVKVRQMCISNNTRALINGLFSGIHPTINLRNDLLHYKAIKTRAGSTLLCAGSNVFTMKRFVMATCFIQFHTWISFLLLDRLFFNRIKNNGTLSTLAWTRVLHACVSSVNRSPRVRWTDWVWGSKVTANSRVLPRPPRPLFRCYKWPALLPFPGNVSVIPTRIRRAAGVQ